MDAPNGLSSPRKKLVIIGFLLAVWCTAGMALLLAGALADSEMDETSAGYAIVALVFIPSLAGFAVSLCAQDRRLHNPMSVWVAIACNSLLLVGYVALVVVGLMS